MTERNVKRAKKALVDGMDMSSLDGIVGFHLRKAILKAQSTFAKAAGRNMMTGQWAVMAIIRDNPGRTQTAIAEAAGLDRSSLVPILNQLEKSGFIVREPVVDDRRAHAVRMTDKGLAELSGLDAEVQIIEEKVVHGLGAQDHALLIDLLKQFHKVI